MAPTRYSLHYEDYSEHLMSRFGKLLQMQSMVDMTLMCSSHTLRVHKAVLAASSAYFQEVLQKQSGEPLIILKMRFSVLKSLVEFMYCGKTQCLEENLDELVSAAQFLKIKGLSKVTKEGLGIANSNDLPVFTRPVVINRPPQSLIDLHSQQGRSDGRSSESHLPAGTSGGQMMDSTSRSNKDMMVRIPIELENGPSGNMEYSDKPRSLKPRRGRPSIRQQRANEWSNTSGNQLNRAAERELLKREQDSRKAINQLRNLQTQQINEYMESVSLSHAVSSICGSGSGGGGGEGGPGGGWGGGGDDLLYLEGALGGGHSQPPLNAAMSQYVAALKNAGLPTDLPILFESGDGSYINVNEEVLLDMVQSTEIQYEVIEQPNIIEKVSDPAEIKSIDDISKSIERGEILMNGKNYNTGGYEKHQFRHEDAINTLNSILPDNLESFGDQQNYVVLDPRMQETNNSIDSGNVFSCIDGDMQFFTKSMSDDVKKYYEGDQLDCPTSTSLESNFTISMLDKDATNMEPQYNLNPEDLRRNDDCYDFDMQLSQTADFKGDLDCLIATPRRIDDGDNPDSSAKAREEIIKDLMNFENKINMATAQTSIIMDNDSNDKCDVGNGDFISRLNVPEVFDRHSNETEEQALKDTPVDLSAAISSDIQWDTVDDIDNKGNDAAFEELSKGNPGESGDNQYSDQTPITLVDTIKIKGEGWDDMNSSILNPNEGNENEALSSSLQEDIPFAVGLLPLKQMQTSEDSGSLLKRRRSVDLDVMDNVDAQCLKRKVKLKKT